MNPIAITILRWIARIPGALMGLLFVFMVVGETISPPPNHPNETLTGDTVMQLSFTFIGILGLLLAWRWEMAGGILALVAFAALGAVNPHTVPWPLLAFIIPAVIFIFTAWLSRRHRGPSVPAHP